MKKIYIGNLPFTATEAAIRNLFAPHGEVGAISLMTHSPGDLPRGFGYVEMEDGGVAGAISALNGFLWNGRRLMVNEARPRISGE